MVLILLLLLLPLGCLGQFGFEEEDTEYKGLLIGTFNSYHHQVNGEVYAVDDYTLLIKNFVYDGNGKDTFFWAGGSNRPGTQGFIVPNEKGRTNVLKRLEMIHLRGNSRTVISWCTAKRSFSAVEQIN